MRIKTTTKFIALAMHPDGLIAFNHGVYTGTDIPLRRLTGKEKVVVIGSTAGARLECDTWIEDRFGPLGARQIKRLINLIKEDSED